MSAGDINLVKKNNNKKSRRRKKRRTADSSDSDSDSSSSSGSDNESKLELTETLKEEEVQVSDVELSDEERETKTATEELSIETKEALHNISYTDSDLTRKVTSSQKNEGNNIIDLNKVKETINDSREQLSKSKRTELKNEYLGLLFQNYGDDINTLREAPDFTNKSLILLANVLKDGSNMFDTDTLKTILESK